MQRNYWSYQGCYNLFSHTTRYVLNLCDSYRLIIHSFTMDQRQIFFKNSVKLLWNKSGFVTKLDPLYWRGWRYLHIDYLNPKWLRNMMTFYHLLNTLQSGYYCSNSFICILWLLSVVVRITQWSNIIINAIWFLLLSCNEGLLTYHTWDTHLAWSIIEAIRFQYIL